MNAAAVQQNGSNSGLGRVQVPSRVAPAATARGFGRTVQARSDAAPEPMQLRGAEKFVTANLASCVPFLL
jgi:hypothetical protein